MLTHSTMVCAQENRVIYVKGPELLDTHKYEYSIWVRRNTGSYPNRIWSSLPAHFELDSSFQTVEIVVPNYVEDHSFEIDLAIEEKSNWRYYSAYQSKEVKMTSDTVHVQIEPVNLRKVKRHFSKERLRLAFDWDLFQSKILTVSYYQGHQPYGEVMFSLTEIEDFHDYPIIMYGPAIGTEFNFEWNDDFLLGPKLGFYCSTPIVNVGLYGVAYTDFERSSWYLKPRVGINPLTTFVNISYEYAIQLSPNHFGTRINRHQLAINVNIPLYMD